MAGVIGVIARTGVIAEATVGALVDLAAVVREISITVAVRVVDPAAVLAAAVPQGSVGKAAIVLRVAVVDFPGRSLEAKGIVPWEIVVLVQLDLRVLPEIVRRVIALKVIVRRGVMVVDRTRVVRGLPEIARTVVMVAAIEARVVMVAAQIVVIVVTIVRKKSVHAWLMAGGPVSSLSLVPWRPWPNKSKPPVAPILSSTWRSCSFLPGIGIWSISFIKIPLLLPGRIQPKSLLRFLPPRPN